MIQRIVLATLSSLTLMFGAAGCADMPEDGELNVTTGANTICPAVYEPVCGKDGMTYSNVCYAGGQNRVAYAGECVDPCLSTTCVEGTVCEVRPNGQAWCVAPNPCWTVRCGEGTECVVRGGNAVCR